MGSKLTKEEKEKRLSVVWRATPAYTGRGVTIQPCGRWQRWARQEFKWAKGWQRLDVKEGTQMEGQQQRQLSRGARRETRQMEGSSLRIPAMIVVLIMADDLFYFRSRC